MGEKLKILFFSTGNAVRSQMAEGILRSISGAEVESVCTAVRPESHPLAKEVMQEIGIDLSEDVPKEIARLFREDFTCVITLSDPTRERAPVWPFTRNLYHWRLEDPLEGKSSWQEQREALRHVRDEIHDKVRDFARQVAPRLKAKGMSAGA